MVLIGYNYHEKPFKKINFKQLFLPTETFSKRFVP